MYIISVEPPSNITLHLHPGFFDERHGEREISVFLAKTPVVGCKRIGAAPAGIGKLFKMERNPFAEVRMKKECSSCHGTGKCPLCKGTGHFGYPGIGPVDMYPTKCSTCQGSGDCRACRGTGQK